MKAAPWLSLTALVWDDFNELCAVNSCIEKCAHLSNPHVLSRVLENALSSEDANCRELIPTAWLGKVQVRVSRTAASD